MNFYTILLLVAATHVSVAQHLLIKKDGDHVPYKKLKNYGKYIEATKEDKSRVTVLEKDVIGYFDGHLKQIFYKKPAVVDNERFSPYDKDTVNGFQVLEREMVGRINLYKKEVITSGSGATSTSAYYYYGEKQDQFKNVFITGFGSKKDDLIALRSFVSDDREILNKIIGENFVLNEKIMLGIIKEYNLKHFRKPKSADYHQTGTINFYTTVNPKLKETISLNVNDSIEHNMPTTHYPLPIKLPLNVPSKVCVTWETGTLCELIQPIPFAVDCYEVTYSMFEKSFDIKSRTDKDLESYIRRTRAK